MGRKIFQIAFIIFVLLAFAKAINEYLSKLISDPSEFEFYIKSFPTGSTSRVSTINFAFAQDFDADDFPINEAINIDLIHFNPRIKGTLYWTNKRNLEFLPTEPLDPGESYFYRVNLNKIFSSKQKIKVFRNNFTTPEIKYQVEIDHLQYVDSIFMKAEGNIMFSDQIDFQSVHNILSVYQKQSKLPLRINQGNKLLSYQFTIDSIRRKNKRDTLNIIWKESIESEKPQVIHIPIPAQHSFEVLNTAVTYHENNSAIHLYFSNPLPDKDSGTIEIIGAPIVSEFVNLNEYTLVLQDSIIPKYVAINVPSNFHDIYGNELGQKYFEKLNLNDHNPQLENFYNIPLTALPEGQLKLSIKAKNLQRVKIKAFEIPKQNALQYLQTNVKDLDEIKRVGKKIDEQNINLSLYPNYKPEMLKQYIVDFKNIAPKKGSIIQYAISYDADCIFAKPRNNNYKQHDTIIQNIVYTDLNAIAKITPTDTIEVYVFNSRERKAVRNAKVEIYDFQQHLLSSSQTNRHGKVSIRANNNIAFLKILHQDQIFYIKLNKHKRSEKESSFSYLNPFFFSNKTTFQSEDSLVLGLMLNSNVALKNYPLIIKYDLTNTQGDVLYSDMQSYSNNQIFTIRHKIPTNVNPGKHLATFSLLDQKISYPITIINNNLNTSYCEIREEKTKNDTLPALVLANKKSRITDTLNNHYSIALVTAIKKHYQINDTLSFSLNSKAYRSIFVSIENLSQVIYSDWFSSAEATFTYAKKIQDNLWPGAFVNITAIDYEGVHHSWSQSIKVNNPAKELKPIIISSFDFEADDLATLRIKENEGNEMEYVIMFRSHTDTEESNTFNPYAFYNKVSDQQIQSFGSYQSQIQTNKTHTYQPFAKFIENKSDKTEHLLIGPFHLKENEINNHRIKTPNIIGKGQISVICRSKTSTKFGYSTKDIALKRPIFAKFEHPKTLQPNEELIIQSQIFINKMQSKEAIIELDNPVNCTFIEDSRFTIPLSSSTNSYPFRFKIKTNGVAGLAAFNVSVIDSNQTFTQTIRIPVQSLNPKYILSQTQQIGPESIWQTRILPKGLKGTNKGSIEFSHHHLPLFQYTLQKINLVHYNDISSSLNTALPILYFPKITSLTPIQKDSINQLVNACIKNILPLIQQDGTFNVSSFSAQENIDFNLFAGQFLIEARNNEFLINERLYKRWIRSVEFDVQFADYTQDNVQYDLARKLYLLALADEANMVTMKNLSQQNNLSDNTAVYLAMAYALKGKNNIATNLISGVEIDQNLIDGSNFDANLVMLRLNQILKNDAQCSEITNSLNKLVLNNNKLTNRQLSKILLYLSKWMINEKTNHDIALEYRINKGKINALLSENSIVFESIPIEFTLPKSIDIKNLQPNDLYSSITLTGTPQKPLPIKSRTALRMNIAYLDSSGNALSLKQLKQDQCFESEITLKNISNKNINDLIVIYPYASGWKYLPSYSTNHTNYSEIKDDETNSILYTIDIPANSTLHIPIHFEAQYQGKFYLAPVRLMDKNTNKTLIQLNYGYSSVLKEKQTLKTGNPTLH